MGATVQKWVCFAVLPNVLLFVFAIVQCVLLCVRVCVLCFACDFHLYVFLQGWHEESHKKAESLLKQLLLG